VTDEYPTEEELNKIREWDIVNGNVNELIEFIENIWWSPDFGFKRKGENLELHTAGWSGNEDIIEALQDNDMFWMMYWMKSVRGGHYYFRI